MNIEQWIRLIQALTPVIIAISEPLLKNATNQITESIAKAEKTGMNGPDKLGKVLHEVIPEVTAELPANEAEDKIIKVVDMAVAAANTVARMNDFNKQ